MKELQKNEMSQIAGGWGLERALDDLSLHTLAGGFVGGMIADHVFYSGVDTVGFWACAYLGYYAASVLDTWEFTQRFNGLNEAEYFFRA